MKQPGLLRLLSAVYGIYLSKMTVITAEISPIKEAMHPAGCQGLAPFTPKSRPLDQAGRLQGATGAGCRGVYVDRPQALQITEGRGARWLRRDVIPLTHMPALRRAQLELEVLRRHGAPAVHLAARGVEPDIAPLQRTVAVVPVDGV
jgi:hypothetical protein